MSEHDEAVEHSEADRVNGEKIDRGDVRHVVFHERSPRLGRWLLAADPVLPDRGFRHLNAQKCELILDPRNTPGRIVLRLTSDQISYLKRNLRSPGPLFSGKPSPIELKALAVPSDHSIRLDNNEA